MHFINKIIIAVALLAAMALLFGQLGHYSLWDDETMVALVAKGVMATGDTSAIIDHGNIVAYRSGVLLHHLHDRSTPPLATYLTAASFAVLGINTWAARLPFAIFGLASFALLLYWARNWRPPVLIAFALGLLGNVSLLLQFRQCRYYAPSIFFSILTVYLYQRWCSHPGGGRRWLWAMALSSIFLFASNYLNDVILYVCLLMDYLLWQRKRHPLKINDWIVLLLPQIIICGLLALVWNPMKTGEGDYASANGRLDKMVLVFWYFRDLNRCEFFALPALLLAFVLGCMNTKSWLLRGLCSLVVYIVTLSLLSPQTLYNTTAADIRYAGALIPLTVAITVAVIHQLSRGKSWLTIALAVLFFTTNFCNGGYWSIFGLRSTIVSYLAELANPPPEPYGPTADWINQHIPEGKTVFIAPDYAIYPLMFHAPKALYAWQFNQRHGDYTHLPAEHFKGEVMPDYLIGFGPHVATLIQEIKRYGDQKTTYALVDKIDVFWKDLYRPELFWRTFTPITGYNKNRDVVFIFQRQPAPLERRL